MIKFFAGLFIGLSITAAVADGIVTSVPTNGVLEGYIVQKDGKDICRDPVVYNRFHGASESYIVCDE